jgi:hypothetical protein
VSQGEREEGQEKNDGPETGESTERQVTTAEMEVDVSSVQRHARVSAVVDSASQSCVGVVEQGQNKHKKKKRSEGRKGLLTLITVAKELASS